MISCWNETIVWIKIQHTYNAIELNITIALIGKSKVTSKGYKIWSLVKNDSTERGGQSSTYL